MSIEQNREHAAIASGAHVGTPSCDPSCYSLYVEESEQGVCLDGVPTVFPRQVELCAVCAVGEGCVCALVRCL